MPIKILAVDDEPRNLIILEEILEDHYEIHTAKNGLDGLNKYNALLPEIVLLDIMMPGMDGYEVCNTIRKTNQKRYSKIVLISGKNMIEEKIKGYDSGADDYITKPFDHEELLAKIAVYSKLIQAEQEIIDLNRNLENQVEIRTNQLLKTEKMAFIGAHTAEVVHNLNNPLSVIKAHSNKLNKELPENKRVIHILKAVQKIEDMITMILDAGRKEASLKKQPININDVIESELELLKTDAYFKYDIVIEKNLSSLPPLVGIYSNFSQIMGNLIKNAAEAMHGQKNKKLTIKTEKADKHIIVRIQDTGCGISPENISKLFDPFFTTKPIDSENGEPTGTGLGLSSVKKMIESYGGTIEISSHLNEGTEFKLNFPTSIIGHFSNEIAA